MQHREKLRGVVVMSNSDSGGADTDVNIGQEEDTRKWHFSWYYK